MDPKEEEKMMLEGGPGDEATETNEEVEVPKPEEPLHKGLGGHIKTPEELVEYTKSIEEQFIKLKAATPPPAPIVSQTPTEDPEIKEIESVWYSNPTKAMGLLEQRFGRKLEMVEQAKADKKKWFNEFYDENPDLKDSDRIVQLVIKDKFAEYKDKSYEEAKKLVAKEVRDLTSSVRKNSGVSSTELESRPAVTFGSTKVPATKVPAKPAAPKNFISQLAEMRKRSK